MFSCQKMGKICYFLVDGNVSAPIDHCRAGYPLKRLFPPIFFHHNISPCFAQREPGCIQKSSSRLYMPPPFFSSLQVHSCCAHGTSSPIESQRQQKKQPSRGELLNVCFSILAFLPAVATLSFSHFHSLKSLTADVFLIHCPTVLYRILGCFGGSWKCLILVVSLRFYIFTTTVSYFL